MYSYSHQLSIHFFALPNAMFFCFLWNPSAHDISFNQSSFNQPTVWRKLNQADKSICNEMIRFGMGAHFKTFSHRKQNFTQKTSEQSKYLHNVFTWQNSNSHKLGARNNSWRFSNQFQFFLTNIKIIRNFVWTNFEKRNLFVFLNDQVGGQHNE